MTEMKRPGVVDAHNHLGRWLSRDAHRSGQSWVTTDLAGGSKGTPWAVSDVDALLSLLDECGVEVVVNLDGRWADELEANLERYDRVAPERFVTFCQLDWALACRGNGFGDHLARSLERSVSAGAQGLKVWKTLGLGWRDVADRLLLPDDPRIAPVWHQAADLELPVLIHTADPAFFFARPDKDSRIPPAFHGHPDCSFYGSDFPSRGRLLDAFETLLGSHPQTTFIGAHLAMVENLPRLERLLNDHPNLYVDVSGRLSELEKDTDATRAFLSSQADRILFGSDAFPPDVGTYRGWFSLLEDRLALSDDVLQAIYRANALQILNLSNLIH